MISILSLFFIQCGSDNPINELPKEDDPIDNPTPPPTEGIKPAPGMDLYGMILDDKGEPVSNVVVTDGYSCTTTNSKGIYQMKKDDKATLVYYSSPSDYEVNTSSETVKTASFYSQLTAGNKRYDFELKKLSSVEKDFTLLAIGDPQVKNTSDIKRFETETMADIKKFVATQTTPAYGIALGDIVHDKMEYFGQMKRLMGSTDMIVHAAIGNHDKESYTSSTQPRTTSEYNKALGPVNYSFNRGDVHFVALDNIIFANASDYRGGFTDEQVEWLRQDLSHVSKDKMVILYYHIPLRSHNYNNRDRILQLLNGYAEVHLMAGHTHYNENFMIKSPIPLYEHIHAAACGSWWHSTLNGDGTPNGYAVYHISGPTIKEWYYKPTNYSKDFQMRLHRGDVTFGGQYGQYSYSQGKNTVVANVWNADDKWKIEAFEDGKKVADLKPLSTQLRDSWTLGYHIGVLNRNPDNYSPRNKHLFLHTMVNPYAELEIRATDRFGNVYTESEIVSDHTTASSYIKI